jgi:hypothetical protein
MTPEERREYNRMNYQKNKEKIKERKRNWKKNNQDKVKEMNKKYYQTSEGKKAQRIGNWKRIGVFHDDYNKLYKEYIETERCDICGVYLTEDKRKTKTTRCLDHDHDTGFVRNIVCHSCNVKIG